MAYMEIFSLKYSFLERFSKPILENKHLKYLAFLKQGFHDFFSFDHFNVIITHAIVITMVPIFMEKKI